MKFAGLPAGSGFTSISTGADEMTSGVFEPSRDPPKKSSKRLLALRRSRTWASIERGSILFSPGPVGKSTERRITAVA